MPKVAFSQADVDTWNRADNHQIKVNDAYIEARHADIDALVKARNIKPKTPEYAQLVDPILMDIGATEWLNMRIRERVAKRVPSGEKPSTVNPFRSAA